MDPHPHFNPDFLDSLFEGVYFLDSRRRIVYWNRAAEDITGYAADEVIGRSCADNILVHVDDKGTNLCLHGCPVSQVLKDGQPVQKEVYFRHKDGHRVSVAVRVSPVFDDRGRITGAVEFFSDNTSHVALRQRIAELEKQALLDPLTFVANRRCLQINIEARLQEMDRYGSHFGLMFLDLDRFKSVNDTYGHDVGDEVLKLVARTLSSNTRIFDIIGRWGGEEFLGILINMDAGGLSQLAEKFRTLVERSTLKRSRYDISVTVSIGVTMAKRGDSLETLINRADRLMYRSKTEGRNRVTIG